MEGLAIRDSTLAPHPCTYGPTHLMNRMKTCAHLHALAFLHVAINDGQCLGR